MTIGAATTTETGTTGRTDRHRRRAGRIVSSTLVTATETTMTPKARVTGMEKVAKAKAVGRLTFSLGLSLGVRSTVDSTRLAKVLSGCCG